LPAEPPACGCGGADRRYASHLVEGQPLQRIFYELYRDKAAFEAHEAAPHTRRYLAERDQYLASTEVDWLTLQAGKGTDA
jgi:quinol monooxygenase YgiN